MNTILRNWTHLNFLHREAVGSKKPDFLLLGHIPYAWESARALGHIPYAWESARVLGHIPYAWESARALGHIP